MCSLAGLEPGAGLAAVAGEAERSKQVLRHTVLQVLQMLDVRVDSFAPSQSGSSSPHRFVPPCIL